MDVIKCWAPYHCVVSRSLGAYQWMQRTCGRWMRAVSFFNNRKRAIQYNNYDAYMATKHSLDLRGMIPVVIARHDDLHMDQTSKYTHATVLSSRCHHVTMAFIRAHNTRVVRDRSMSCHTGISKNYDLKLFAIRLCRMTGHTTLFRISSSNSS